MKRLIAFLLIPFLLSADPSLENKPPTVRVLLTKLIEQTRVEVSGPFSLYSPITGELIKEVHKKKKGLMTTSNRGIKWGKAHPGAFELRIVPASPSTRIRVNGVPYRGCMEIHSIGGTLNIVNEVTAENFLKATLSPRLSSSCSKTTLDALAITERTHLYYLLAKEAHASWQVEAAATGYQGARAPRANRALAAAIDRTAGMVLNYKKRPFPTSWSPNHTGKSASYQTIFRKKVLAPSGSRSLLSASSRPQTKWETSISLKDLAKALQSNPLKAIYLFRDKESNKVYAARMETDKGKKDLSIHYLQQILPLKSNDFQVEVKKGKAYFTGYGTGLGVGLCLQSAELMARRGDEAKTILRAHFPHAELINPERELARPANPIWH